MRLLVLFLLFPISSFGSVIYSYTGSPFDTFVGPLSNNSANAYRNGGHVSIEMELAVPLIYFDFGTVTPLAWTISDGLHTFNSQRCASCTVQFDLETDQQGVITSSIVTFNSQTNGYFQIDSDYAYCVPWDCTNMFDDATFVAPGSQIAQYAAWQHGGIPNWRVVASPDPEPTPVQEPVAVWLMACALLPGYFLINIRPR